jgi:hypothetical protein
MVMMILDACVPAPARESLREQLKEEADSKWRNLGSWVIGIAAGYTLTLGLGFVIHSLV